MKNESRVSENNETIKCPNNANFRYTWPGKNESYCCRFHSIGIERVANAIGMYLQLIPLSSASKIPCNSRVTQETLSKMVAEVEQNER